jgi:hypothetical protein
VHDDVAEPREFTPWDAGLGQFDFSRESLA